MLRIDAHQHFWNFDPVRDAWITGEMQKIRRDFTPADLYPELKAAHMDGCIAVQADQSEQETEFLLQLAEENGFIKAVVGWVDLSRDDVGARLERFKRFKYLKGFRHILQGEQNRQYMFRADFKRGIAALAGYDFTYDILIHNDQLPFVTEMVSAFPEQKFVLDHMAKPPIRKKEIEEWKKGIKQLAQYPNIWCKVSGMTTEADWVTWEKKDLEPYMEVVVAAFGMRRLLFGSDWPVCLLAGTYQQTLEIVEDYFSSFSVAEKEAFFGGNAADFYNI